LKKIFKITSNTIYLNLKKYILFMLILSFLCSCTGSKENNIYYQEIYRPQFHFSPETNWMNDPNGMFYYQGEYHLFYQYNPFGNKWGHMSWGHAISPDMIHWKHLPVALPEEDGIMIFSGSAVVDWKNSSGFGSESNPPIVAIYTGRRNSDNLQFQCIAYSIDNGRSWTKYDNNPVLDIQSKNFRDPKVIWYEPDQRWVMVVSLAIDRKLQFYGSPNLKDWTLLSEFGPAGAVNGIWECPDLFPLNVDSDPNKIKWILEVDLGSHSIAGGSGGQFFVGDFNGREFRLDENIFSSVVVEEKVPQGELIADFEGNSYGDWIIKGDAFGSAPARGSFVNQNEVIGFKGHGFVNSFFNGDISTGSIKSPSFKINTSYLNFLIAGGNHKDQTCMKLIVDGRVVRNATGNNSETLEWNNWDVKDLKDKTANILIVDVHKGGWGHINVDHIIQADSPVQPRMEQALWVDYGKDFYAAVSWSDILESDGRRLWLGWMSNWQYAQEVPTYPWRSAMSIPRKLKLKTFPHGIRLVQTPVKELKNLRRKHQNFSDISISNINQKLINMNLVGNMLEMDVLFNVGSSREVGVKIRKSENEMTNIAYNSKEKILFIDRTNSGNKAFHDQFPGIHTAPLKIDNGNLKLHIFIDWSSVEVFANDGEVVFTDLLFPSPGSNGIEFYSNKGEAQIKSLNIWELKSIW
jgi:sucrose-6-phosphate hydrolase SacC (GH32 family)